MSMLESKVVIKCDRSKSKVKQADARSCDINNIIKTFTKTGKLPDMVQRNFIYGDFAKVPDYQKSMEIVAFANEQFMSLPSELRNRFKNDPAEFLAFVDDKANYDEAVSLGLIVVPEPKVDVVPEPKKEEKLI